MYSQAISVDVHSAGMGVHHEEEAKLLEHSKTHTPQHITLMRELMAAGKSFDEAHKEAMKMAVAGPWPSSVSLRVLATSHSPTHVTFMRQLMATGLKLDEAHKIAMRLDMHAKTHSSQHVALMRRLMAEGMTFEAAHKQAMAEAN